MVSRLLNLFRRSYDPGKPARRGREIGDVVAAALEGRWPVQFERVHDLVWTSESENHIRRIFNFQAMKGVTYSACWGVSIDFVPLTGRKGLRSVEIQDSTSGLIVIQALDGTICADGRPMGEDGTALSGQADRPRAKWRR